MVVGAETREHRDRQSADRPELTDAYRWTIEEWSQNQIDRIERGARDDLAPANAELDRRREEHDDDISDFRTAVWLALATAMSVLYEEGFFDRWPHSVRVIAVSDGGVPEDLLRLWTSLVNPPEVSAQFAQYLASEAR